LPVICEDLFATLIAWGGATETVIDDVARAESVPRPIIDGLNRTRLLREDGDIEEQELLYHYPHVWGPHGAGYQPHTALNVGRHKVIYFYQPRRWELYDLSDDIGESKDLAESQPELLSQLADKMIERLRSMDALYPTNRDTGDPEEPLPPSSAAPLVPSPSQEDRASAAGSTSGGTWLGK
jgi:arylsulfatase A-like enzyme